MNSLIGLEWRDKNLQRNYPFADSADLSIGAVGFLPIDLIVDARIYLRGAYAADATPYIGKIETRPDQALIYIYINNDELGVVELPWALELTEAAGSFPSTVNATADVRLAALLIKNKNIVNGVVVVNIDAVAMLQALAQGSYTFNSTQLQFVPFVCEHMPGPQVTSANELINSITLRGETGIKVERMNATDIKISIVGDPHFTRYDCLPGNEGFDLFKNQLPTFLNQLSVLHYVKNESGALIGPFKSTLKINHGGNGLRTDGSIDFHLVSATGQPREFRPAFRLTARDNSLIFSMAGA